MGQVDNIQEWIHNVPPRESGYWEKVRIEALRLKSDGCTFVSDIFLEACYEHDIHWRTGKTLEGLAITVAQANTRFRLVIQHRSRFGRYSPIAWIRWTGVLIGSKFLKHHESV